MDEEPSLTTRLKGFVAQCGRVWHVLRKPSALEFKTVAKVSALGILVIGAIGFLVADGIRIFVRLFS